MEDLKLTKDYLEDRKAFTNDLPDILKKGMACITDNIDSKLITVMAGAELIRLASNLRKSILLVDGTVLPVNAFTVVLAGSGIGKDKSLSALRGASNAAYTVIEETRILEAQAEAKVEKATPAKTEEKKETAPAAKKETAAKKAPAEKKEPAAKKAPAKKAASKTSADDLKKIEGIGPKIADTLNDAGVKTFADLAKMERDAIKAILDTVSTLKSKEPKTWPQQAQLAADGKWDELKVLQDELMGGI